MKKCVVIGGGLAGLSAAVYLAGKNIKVTLIESSPKLGGRAYSFLHPSFEQYVDNGQHIMTGCYRHTFDFLKKINAINEVETQNEMRVPFVKEGGEEFLLNAGSFFYPLNLTSAILRYRALSLRERFSVLRFFINDIIFNAHISKDITVAEWLKRGGQGKEEIECLWEILAVGTLNASMQKTSASLFRDILRELFLTGSESSKIVMPKNSLSHTFVFNAIRFIEENGGEVLTSVKADKIIHDGRRVNSILTNRGDIKDFDYVISAVPLRAFKRLVFEPFTPQFNLPALEDSSILSLHIKLESNPFKEPFYGFIGSEIHWLFNKGSYITLVTSSADKLTELDNDSIIRKFCFEIQKYFHYFNTVKILDFLVVREKNATFIPASASNLERKNIFSPLTNFVLAGDWVDTKLPATIEGAIKSGRGAADQVI